MREIKFRAWMEPLKKMDYSPINAVTFDGKKVYFGNGDITGFHSALMQYTGLKDKNGVEIYEGDIIASWYDFDTTGKEQVVFDKGQYTLKGSQWSLAGHLSHYPGEVIGNIYENPGLLEDKK